MTIALIQAVAIESVKWTTPALVLLALCLVWVSAGTSRSQSAVSWAILAAAVSIAAAVLPLFGYWFAARTHPNAIAGVLPWNDAAGYYGCALSVLDGEGLHAFCQRRPAYSLYLAGLMRVAGGELQLALLLQALMNGAAMLVVAYGALRRWGGAAGLVTIAVLAPFAAVTSVATLTENFGFVLGAAGLLLVLSGAERRANWLLATGLFVLSVALNARAGAFLVLPLLVVWPFFADDMSRGRRWRLSALLAFAVAAGFLPGPLLVALLGGPISEIHSNFSYTLYGLAAGGERWTHTLRELPGATSEEIYRAAFALIREQPFLLVAGLSQGFLEYLQRLLIYIPWEPARVLVGGLWVWGIASVFRPRAGDGDRALALLFVGIALSSPVLSIDGDTRVYAATVAVDALFAALGFASLAGGLATHVHRARTALWGLAVLFAIAGPTAVATHDPRAWGGALVLGGLVALAGQWAPRGFVVETQRWFAGAGLAGFMTGVVVVIAFVLPWPGFTGRTPATYELVQACEEGEPAIGRLGRDSPVVAITDTEESNHWPVVTTRDAFRAALDPLTHLHAELDALSPGTAIVFLYDRRTSSQLAVRSGLLVGDERMVRADGRVYQLCVSDGLTSVLTDVRRILSVHPLSDSSMRRR